MAESICIFEDKYCNRLLPLVYLRHVADLRCGIQTLREKIQRSYAVRKVSLHCREYLAGVVRQQNPGVLVNEVGGNSCLFVNGRVIIDGALMRQIPLKGEDAAFISGDVLVAVRSSENKLQIVWTLLKSFDTYAIPDHFPKIEVDAALINYPWDLIKHNGNGIVNDFKILTPKKRTGMVRGKVYKGAVLLNAKNIYIGEGTQIKPGAVLDAENGPIYIGKNATVFPNAVIEGPAFIGDNTLVKIGAKIYENTSIGEMCKVGGEVEASIIHSYSNKQHDGFLGHSYLGMWVNLGAGTNNSDLKNNYGNIKVYINGEDVDSGSMFVGLTMGDHSKSGINTMFNTGTVVGVSSNVFGADFPPKFIPSFTWGGKESMTTYDVEKSIEVARRVMARRKITMTEADEQLFRTVFEMTKQERER